MRSVSRTLPLVIVLALGCVGCGSSTSKPKPAPTAAGASPNPTASVAAPSANAHSPSSTPPVATVASKPISYAEFEHGYDLTAAGGTNQARGCAGSQCVIPDPPTYTKCVSRLSSQIPPGTSKAPSSSKLRAECSRGAKSFTSQAMKGLIRRTWAELAAEQAGITVSSAEVQKAAQAELRTLGENYEQTQSGQPAEQAATPGKSKPRVSESQTDASAERYMSATGLQMSDLEAEARSRLLFAKVVQAAPGQLAEPKEKPAPVSESEIVSYYRGHPAQFSQAQSRDIKIVRTKTLSDARKAKLEIEHGESFQQVGHLDPQENSYHDYLEQETGITPPGSVEVRGLSSGTDPAIQKATFSAALGTLVGPVKGSFSEYYVLRATSQHPGKPYPLSAVKERVRQILTGEHTDVVQAHELTVSEHNQKVQAAFEHELLKKLRKQTSCAKGFVVSLCENRHE